MQSVTAIFLFHTDMQTAVVLLALAVLASAGNITTITVFIEPRTGAITHTLSLVPGGCAQGFYSDDVTENGWGELTVTASDGCPADDQALAMGYAEGVVTADRIYQAFLNFNASNGYLVGGFLPDVLAEYITEQNAWMAEQVSNAQPDDADYDYWMHVGILMKQAAGVALGYQAQAPPAQNLTAEQVYILAMAGDLEDLSAAIPYLQNNTYVDVDPLAAEGKEAPVPVHMDCSGLVKLAENYTDLFVGHTTFNAYWCMLRIFKHYVANFTGMTTVAVVVIINAIGVRTAARTVSFSSRPGDLESKDDFFLMSSHLVSIETSLSIFNSKTTKTLAHTST